MSEARLRRAVVLRVWCPTGTHQVARAFARVRGTLVEIAGTTFLGRDDDGDLRVGRSVFWVEEIEPDELQDGIPISCECAAAEDHRALTYEDIVGAVRNNVQNLGVSSPNPRGSQRYSTGN